MGKKKKDTNPEPAEELKPETEQAETDCGEKLPEPEEKTEAEKLKEELAAKSDAYLRLAAEYDNFRKRTQNEKLAMYEDATAKAIAEILPVADSLDMAIQNSKDAPEQFLKGLELVRNQLAAALAKLKIEPFGEVGEEFDPALHNAVSKIESEELGENRISQIFQKGYKTAGKVIRHAMVQVANCG